jgi:hypothetical protein
MRQVDEFYARNIDSCESKLTSLRKNLRDTSNIRVIIALMFVVSLYAAFNVSTSIFWLAVVLAGGFLVMVKKSSRLEREERLVEKTLELNRNELAFIRGDKSVFGTGTELTPKNHLYALDLDIFGVGSLFQFVNRTVTQSGEKLLVNDLLTPLAQWADIDERSAAVSELEERVEWRQRFYAVGAETGESREDTEEIEVWTKQPQFYMDRRQWPWVACVISAISSVVLLYIIVTFDIGFFPQYFLVVTGLIGVNSTVMHAHAKEQKKYFHQFGRRTKFFEKISELFAMVANHDLKSTLGKRIQDETKAASGAFLLLFKLSNLADQRLNGLMGPLLNGLFCFDVWTIRRIEKWRATYGSEIDGWLGSLARMDEINSLSNFAFNHPGFCKASIDKNSHAIVATDMGHPLLASSVTNDYEVGVSTKAHIITGSNMAGKSTFIRATGLNVILALNGLPVCARKFSCPLLRVVTCIRITDSLEDDTSYFKAELVRLKHIVDVLGEGKECLVLLDEILRGTNSDDKRNGTMAFYRKLRNYDCVALLATHDLTVGQLESEDPAYFGNYCFESTVIDHSLHFDYKLRKGVSRSTNASFLMRGLGLID